MTKQETHATVRKLYVRVHGQELLEVLERAVFDGTVEAICPSCGVSAAVEPDGDYTCYHCQAGVLISPLVVFGVI